MFFQGRDDDDLEFAGVVLLEVVGVALTDFGGVLLRCGDGDCDLLCGLSRDNAFDAWSVDAFEELSHPCIVVSVFL